MKHPTESDRLRLRRYQQFSELVGGKHRKAFKLTADAEVSKEYQTLRYVVANFAGLVAKVAADFLAGEEVRIKAESNTDFINQLYERNEMRTQIYESAIFNAAAGDSVWRIRVENNEIKIEEFSPSMYFPQLSGIYSRSNPDIADYRRIISYGDDRFLINERWQKGMVETTVYAYDPAKSETTGQIPIERWNNGIGKKLNEQLEEEMLYDGHFNLMTHIPNYRLTRGFWGTSDLTDILSLQFALNNRLTKVDNVLDKHSDPILAVPEGVLDEDGTVSRQAFQMLEVQGDRDKPEYITWNANLESAFAEIDKLVEFLFMFTETSPEVLGLGQGKAESGRALKLRLLRTVAKTKRKQLYYRQGLKRIFRIAQELSKRNGYTVDGIQAKEDIQEVEVQFSDGIVDDNMETAQLNALKLDSGTTTRKRAIMAQENVDEGKAESILEEIEEQEVQEPTPLRPNEISF